MNTTTEVVTAVVKDNDVLDATDVAELMHLSLKAGSALEAVLQTMKTACCIYNKNHRMIHETHEAQGSGDLTVSIDLLLRDPSYSFRRQQDL